MSDINKFDLEERTAKFGEGIIDFCKSIKQDPITRPLISQIIRSGTSVGANYKEANSTGTQKDFKHKIHICKKEAEETMHWLRMLSHYLGEGPVISKLSQELRELILIFEKIIRTMNAKEKI